MKFPNLLTALTLTALLVSCGGKNSKEEFSDWDDAASVEADAALGSEGSVSELSDEPSSEDEEQVEDSDNSNGDFVITPKTTKVSGNMGECFEVVDGSYKMVHHLMSDYFEVKVKRTGASLPLNPGEKLGKAYVDEGDFMAVDWTMHFYDESGKEITTLGNYEDVEVMNKFANSSGGTIKMVSFVPSLSDDETFKGRTVGKFSLECNGKHFIDGRPQ